MLKFESSGKTGIFDKTLEQSVEVNWRSIGFCHFRLLQLIAGSISQVTKIIYKDKIPLEKKL